MTSNGVALIHMLLLADLSAKIESHHQLCLQPLAKSLSQRLWPPLKALNTSIDGIINFKPGVIKVSAKNRKPRLEFLLEFPKLALQLLLLDLKQTHLNRVAIITPAGNANKTLPSTIINVPKTNGNTPKDLGSNKGSHHQSKMKSNKETL